MPIAYSAFYPEIRPDVPTCPDDVLENACRNAAIEFCEKALVLQFEQDALSSIADEGEYDFEPPPNTVVCAIEQAFYDGNEIFPKHISELTKEISPDWRDETNTPRFVTQLSETSFRIVPKPSEAVEDGIKLIVNLKPTRSSEKVDNVLYEKYLDAIAAGAKKRLFLMKGRPWSDPAMATYYETDFRRHIQAARNHMVKGAWRGSVTAYARTLS